MTNVAHMEAMRNLCKILVGITQRSDGLGYLGNIERKILIWMLKK